jgi:transcriptional regulator with XRE-family HTH domain
MPNIHQLFAENVKRLLARRKKTAEGLAGSLEIGKAHVSRVLSRKKKASLDFVQGTASYLGVEVADLFKKPQK